MSCDVVFYYCMMSVLALGVEIEFIVVHTAFFIVSAFHELALAMYVDVEVFVARQ